MREIKFRAWDKKNKLWYGRLGQPFTIQDAMVADWSTPMIQLEFMQYTGLKDKNGVEIFEGDIAAFKLDFDTISHRQVVFNNGAFGVGDKLWSLYDHMQRYECEVIGNIYENPELLELPQGLGK